MERFVKGTVVVIPFPFSDLSKSKKRPALVLADLEGNDIILCQITSQDIKDNYAIPLTDNDFQKGSLRKHSNIRPNRLFTADKNIILYQIGNIKKDLHDKVVKAIVKIID
jgi:mRNA interferase MazF